MILLNVQGVVTSAVVVLKDIAQVAAGVEAIEEKEPLFRCAMK